MELTVGGGGGEGAGVADHWRLLSIGERNHFVGKLLDRGKDREDARLADKIFTKRSETISKERSFASNLKINSGLPTHWKFTLAGKMTNNLSKLFSLKIAERSESKSAKRSFASNIKI